jgi:hypothetical protein
MGSWIVQLGLAGGLLAFGTSSAWAALPVAANCDLVQPHPNGIEQRSGNGKYRIRRYPLPLPIDYTGCHWTWSLNDSGRVFHALVVYYSKGDPLLVSSRQEYTVGSQSEQLCYYQDKEVVKREVSGLDLGERCLTWDELRSHTRELRRGGEIKT